MFFADNKTLFCKLCEVKADYEKRSSVTQHVKTEKQRRATEIQQNKNKRLPTTINYYVKNSQFNTDLCRADIS